MKKLTLLGVAILLSALATVQPFATAETPSSPPPAPPPTQTCAPAKQVYALAHWKQAHPERGVQVCPSSSTSKLRQRFADYRTYRLVAPFHAPFGHGPRSPADGRWWAKPWPVICGESRGDFYVNDDGGYQIIPSTWATYGGTAFADKAGHATPLEQHIVAHRAAQAGEPWYGWETDC